MSNVTVGYDLMVNSTDNATLIQFTCEEIYDEVASRSRDWDMPLYDYFKMVILLVICVVGILGNLLNLVILTRRGLEETMSELNRCCHHGLVALSVSDLLFCVVAIPEAIYPEKIFMFVARTFRMFYHMYGLAIFNTFIAASSWLTVVVAYGRYVAVCHGMLALDKVNINLIRVQIAAAFAVSIICNLPRIWNDSMHPFKNVTSYPCEETIYSISKSYMKENPGLQKAYLWFYFITCIVVPLIMIAFCSIKLVCHLKSAAKNPVLNRSQTPAEQQAFRRITITVALILGFYIILVSPADIIFVGKDSSEEYPDRFNVAHTVLQLMQALNFAINVFLYCAVSGYFRKSVEGVLRGRCEGGDGGVGTVEEVQTQHIELNTTTTRESRTGGALVAV